MPPLSDGTLQLDWSRVGLDAADAAVAAVAIRTSRDCCESLLELQLSFNPLIGDAGGAALAEALRALPRLEVLELQECGLGDAAACALADALGGSEAGAAQPTPTPSVLRRLCLGSNPIGDAGCAALAAALLSSPRLLLRPEDGGARGLAVLQLGDTSVGDEGAAALARALEAGAMPSGVQLWLAATRISHAGRERLMSAASRCEAGRTLRVCW